MKKLWVNIINTKKLWELNRLLTVLINYIGNFEKGNVFDKKEYETFFTNKVHGIKNDSFYREQKL